MGGGRRTHRLCATYFVIIDQFLYLGLTITEWARWVLFHRKSSELRFQGVVDQILADERLSLFYNEFNGLCRLNQSDLPGYNSQDTRLVSAGNQARWRRLREETTQTGTSLFGEEDARLSFKLKNPSVDIRFSCEVAGIIDQVFRRKVV